MATGWSLSEVTLDCTCPVCCDIFKDPVLLLCGHSFCKDCLSEWWRQSGSQTCPICKEIFRMRQPPRNLALKNMAETLRQERRQKAPGFKELCSQHNERLKLFCLDDQLPICVVCRDAKQHKTHDCVPIHEAADDHKVPVGETFIKKCKVKEKWRGSVSTVIVITYWVWVTISPTFCSFSYGNISQNVYFMFLLPKIHSAALRLNVPVFTFKLFFTLHQAGSSILW